jgi:hypothetical protein
MSIGQEFEKIAGLGSLIGAGRSMINNGVARLGASLSNNPTVSRAVSGTKNVLGDAWAAGWHGTDRAGNALAAGKNNWFGVKGLTALGTASQLPDAMADVDPTGQNRSKLERLGTVAAGTAGSVLGGSLTAKRDFGGFGNTAASMVGGVLGQSLAEKAVSAVGRPLRNQQKQLADKNLQPVLTTPLN